jgi:hypothetical protein
MTSEKLGETIRKANFEANYQNDNNGETPYSSSIDGGGLLFQLLIAGFAIWAFIKYHSL